MLKLFLAKILVGLVALAGISFGQSGGGITAPIRVIYVAVAPTVGGACQNTQAMQRSLQTGATNGHLYSCQSSMGADISGSGGGGGNVTGTAPTAVNQITVFNNTSATGVSGLSLSGIPMLTAGVPAAAVAGDIANLWPGSGACVLARDGTCTTISSAFSILTPGANVTSGTFSFASPAKFQVDVLYLGGTTGASPILDFSGTTARIRRADQAGNQDLIVSKLIASNTIAGDTAGNIGWTSRVQMQSSSGFDWTLQNSSATARVHLQSAIPTIGSGFGTSPSILGVDSAGRVNVGTGGSANSGVVNFGATWGTAPTCIVNDESTVLLLKAITTTTTLTISTATVFGASDLITFVCLGY